MKEGKPPIYYGYLALRGTPRSHIEPTVNGLATRYNQLAQEILVLVISINFPTIRDRHPSPSQLVAKIRKMSSRV